MNEMNEVKVGEIRVGKGNPLVLIAGPCVIESEANALEVAKEMKEIEPKSRNTACVF